MRQVRDLVVEMVIRDLKIRYKRSVLGFAWSLVLPLAQLLVFALVFQNILPINVADYPAFVFCGLLPFTWFSASLVAATTAITDNRELVKRPGFPVAVLPVIAVVSNLVHFVLALPILLLFVAFFSNSLRPTALVLPLVIAIQFVFSLGIGYLLATVQVRFRDTQHLLTVFLQLLFYLTPVFYDYRGAPARFRRVFDANPMVHLLDSYRSLLLSQPSFDLRALLTLGGCSLALVWFGHRTFVRTSTAFAEEL